MSRLVFHIDVNSAYLSWEAARRVAAGEADLRLIPSAIGGDREKRTGVILAKSILTKRKIAPGSWIRPTMPYTKSSEPPPFSAVPVCNPI